MAIAAYSDNVKAFGLLLQRGAEIQKSQIGGITRYYEGTALSTALYAGNDAAFYLLLDSGADRDMDRNGIYAISAYGNADIIKKLSDTRLTQNYFSEALEASALEDQATKVSLLLKAGVDSESTRNYERSIEPENTRKLLS